MQSVTFLYVSYNLGLNFFLSKTKHNFYMDIKITLLNSCQNAEINHRHLEDFFTIVSLMDNTQYWLIY